MLTTMPFPHVIRTLRTVLLVFALLLCVGIAKTVGAVPIFPSDLRGESISFLPYLEYVLDEKGSLDIDAIAVQEKSLKFLPLRPLDLELNAGTYWLRFTIAPLPEGAKAVEWLLSLGESLPGDPTFYVSEQPSSAGMQRWRSITVTDRHILNLPEAGSEPKTCYIRLAGPPGLWFAPMLRTPHNAANNWGALAHPAAVLVLAIITLLCLLRCFSERGQWRIWTVFYVGSALAAGYLGLPTIERGHIGFSQFASTITPGVTLMLLPHVARHIMRSRTLSRIVDAQLILLTLIGAAVALFPLVPGYSQTARFLELWPLGTIFFIPTALWALFIGLPGSQRFLLMCFFPPLFTAAGILGLLSGLPADFLSAFPLCGVVLSALLLVSSPNPPLEEARPAETNEPVAPNADLDLLSMDPPTSAPKPKAKSKKADTKAQEGLVLKTDSGNDAMSSILAAFRSLEERSVSKTLHAQIVALREQAERISDALCGTQYGKDESDEAVERIDLQYLMRSMYSCAVQESQDTGIALAWYMPPELPVLYQGNAKRLHSVLLQLVESAVSVTKRGSVHFTVRHYPKSADPGHLLFTITDTGDPESTGIRSGLAVANAWTLASDLHGALTLLSDAQGTTISLALHLTLVDEKESLALNPQPLILLCSKNSSARREIKAMLSGMPCRFAEADSVTKAQEIHAINPAILVVIHDTLATPKATLLIRSMLKQAKTGGLPFCKILAITRTDEHWSELGKAGFTHALVEPIDEEALRNTVAELLTAYDAVVQSQSVCQATPLEPIPDLFGKEQGGVPKDIDELIDIARVLNSLSSMKDISKQVEAKGVEPKNAEQIQPTPSVMAHHAHNAASNRIQKIKEELGDEDLLTKYLTESAEDEAQVHSHHTVQKSPLLAQEVHPNPVSIAPQKASTNETAVSIEPQADKTGGTPTKGSQSKKASQSSSLDRSLSFDEPAVGEPRPVPPKTPHTSLSFDEPAVGEPRPVAKGASQNTRDLDLTLDDGWVGEPRPVETKKQNTADLDFNLDDGWVGEPRPVETKKQKRGDLDLDLDDGWVGEPRPVETKKQKRGDLDLDLDDGWVGEPRPVPTKQSQQAAQDEPNPAFLELAKRLTRSMEEATRALEGQNYKRVADAAARIERESDAYSLRVLSRVANCVVRAAQKEDRQALKDLLPELEHQVERNTIALKQTRKKQPID
ncbi:MAG: hypothetical protein IJS54_03380 [Desulfovibrio sp.]|nr:hypothetical protein [Desulfovibrio sp.]